jgi:hypothetical protein
VEIPDEVFVRYEWVQELSGYRESLIPAALVNECPREIVDEDEERERPGYPDPGVS